MNWLLRPWTTPKLELTVFDEILGVVEVLVVVIVVVIVWSLIVEYLHKWR